MFRYLGNRWSLRWFVSSFFLCSFLVYTISSTNLSFFGSFSLDPQPSGIALLCWAPPPCIVISEIFTGAEIQGNDGTSFVYFLSQGLEFSAAFLTKIWKYCFIYFVSFIIIYYGKSSLVPANLLNLKLDIFSPWTWYLYLNILGEGKRGAK